MVIDIRGRDSERTWLGRVHRRAFPSAKRAAALHEHTPWTEYEHRRFGSPLWRSILNAQPFVAEVFLVTVKAMHDLADWSPERLEEREKQIDAEIMQAVADMVRVTHTPGSTPADRVEADQALMELLATRTAIRVQTEKKRTTNRGH